jgi:hypothetical protein
MKKVLAILVSGPYRSGTGGDPHLMESNFRKLEDTALILFRAGHIPVIGEWLSSPLLKVAKSKNVCDHHCDNLLYPVAARLIQKCDAVLRLPGASTGADEDVRIAKQHHIPVYFDLADILNM